MSPQFRALVVENVLIGLMVVDAISLATLCTVAMGGTNILIFPLVIEWFRVFVAGIYLIVMAHRRLHSDFWLPVATFSGETILGAITTTILSLRRNLCDEFHNLPKPCSAAQVAVSLAYITTSAALLSLLARTQKHTP
ncbi:hypothetical protein C8F01DRAFT_1250659 [Mycena amicta]|nr:hypothetical protein C8F01DRAFT_1250659 [Mycena amicta]